MFQHLGLGLQVLRELRGLAQAELAREAKIGKSQLSKYEAGRELPKLESLEKVLNSLGVEFEIFAQVLAILDKLSRAVEAGHASEGPISLPDGKAVPLISPGAGEAFKGVLDSVLFLHRRILEDGVRTAGLPRNKRQGGRTKPPKD